MVHLPRRRAVRVRRDEGYQPLVRLRLPQRGGEHILTLADLSISGCALLQAAGTVPLQGGDRAEQVDVALDGQTGFTADLLVRNTAPLPGGGQRVGCAWQGLAPSAQEVLQRWIRGGRRRRELVSLDLA